MKQPPREPEVSGARLPAADPLAPAEDHLLAVRGSIDALLRQAVADAARQEQAVETLVRVIGEVDPDAARRVRAAVRTAGMAHVRAAHAIAAEVLSAASLRANRLASVYADLVEAEAERSAESGLISARRVAEALSRINLSAARRLLARLDAAASDRIESGRALGAELRGVAAGAPTTPPAPTPSRPRRRRGRIATNVVRLRRDDPPTQTPRASADA
jgi:hypothetical protein